MISDEAMPIPVVIECAVATNGQAGGNGSLASPISFDGVLALYETFWPGCHVVLGDGTYTNVGYKTISMSGNPNAFVTIKAAGAATYIDGGFKTFQDYIQFKNLIFENTAYIDRTTEEGGSNPSDIDVTYRIKAEAKYCSIVDCVFHDSATLVFCNFDNFEISDCVLFYGGWVNPDRGHGHGIYTSGNTIKIKNCIILDMFGYGIHCYGESPDVLLKNIDIENCIIIGSGSLVNLENSNILVGGTNGCHADHPLIKNNCTYHRSTKGMGIQIGFGAYGYDGGTAQNNIIVGGANSLVLSGVPAAVITDISGNWFGSAVSGFAQGDWPDNTYSSGVPDLVRVYPSEYTNTLAHVAIFNGASANTVSVDLTTVTGLSVGDDVTVANVQDLFVDIQTLTLDADKKITVNMQAVNRSVATPQGWTAPATTFPQFGAFVVEKA